MGAYNRKNKSYVKRLLAAFVMLTVLVFVGAYVFLNKDSHYPDVRGSGSIVLYKEAAKWGATVNFKALENSLKSTYPRLHAIIANMAALDEIDKVELAKLVSLEIRNEGGRYLWASNNNIPLNLRIKIIDVTPLIDPEDKLQQKRTRVFIFEPVSGEGLVIIVEVLPRKLKKQFWCGPESFSCEKPACLGDFIYNYIEYKPNGSGDLIPYVGGTDRYPYPKPDVCVD